MHNIHVGMSLFICMFFYLYFFLKEFYEFTDSVVNFTHKAVAALYFLFLHPGMQHNVGHKTLLKITNRKWHENYLTDKDNKRNSPESPLTATFDLTFWDTTHSMMRNLKRLTPRKIMKISMAAAVVEFKIHRKFIVLTPGRQSYCQSP